METQSAKKIAALEKAEKLISFLEKKPEDLEVNFYKNQVEQIKRRDRLFKEKLKQIKQREANILELEKLIFN